MGRGVVTLKKSLVKRDEVEGGLVERGLVNGGKVDRVW